jgi:hypothetical protein
MANFKTHLFYQGHYWPFGLAPQHLFTRRYEERELNQLSIMLIRGAHIGAMFASCHIITMVWLYRSSILVGRMWSFICSLWLLPAFAEAIETAPSFSDVLRDSLWSTKRERDRKGKKEMYVLHMGRGGEGRFYQALMCCLPSSPFCRESLQGHPIYIFFFFRGPRRHYNSSHAVKARMLLLYLAQQNKHYHENPSNLPPPSADWTGEKNMLGGRGRGVRIGSQPDNTVLAVL